SRERKTRVKCDWSADVCSSDLRRFTCVSISERKREQFVCVCVCVCVCVWVCVCVCVSSLVRRVVPSGRRVCGVCVSVLWSPLFPSWPLSGEKDPGMLQDSSESSIREDLSDSAYSLL